MTRLSAALALAFALLLSAGCDRYDKRDRPLPQFAATTLDGRSLEAGSFAGRPWVIHIWVPGWGACAREFPELEAARREWEPKGVGFLALSIEPDQAEVSAAALRFGLEGTVATTSDEVLAPFGVRGVPSTAFVDARGRVVASVSGPRDRAFFGRRIRALLESR